MKKRRSKLHDISDSDSEEESCFKTAAKRNSETRNTVTTSNNSPTANKKTFIDEFLNMTSDEEDDCQGKTSLKTKSESLSENSEEIRVSENRKKIESLKKHFKEDRKENKNIGEPAKDSNNYSEKAHKKNYSKPFREDPNRMTKLETDKQNDKTKPMKTSTAESRLSRSGEQSVRQKQKSSAGGLKRKHSRSPVPKELRKAVTEILDNIHSTKEESSKKPCQYGARCYRKNPSHFAEYSHPGGISILFIVMCISVFGLTIKSYSVLYFWLLSR